MFRSILGFALFAALAFVALNIFFGILGGLFGLALWILKLARPASAWLCSELIHR